MPAHNVYVSFVDTNAKKLSHCYIILKFSFYFVEVVVLVIQYCVIIEEYILINF